MTDKQIIIDGVDISECKELVNECDCYLTEEHDYRSETPYTYNNCSRFPNCYYKQLKRKEQECKELKEDLQLAKQLVDWILKTFNLESYDWLADQNEISTEIESIKTKFKSPQSDHYRKALEEIETTVKTECEETCGSKLEDCTNFFCSSKHIIDVINKAKG